MSGNSQCGKCQRVDALASRAGNVRLISIQASSGFMVALRAIVDPPEG